MEKIIMSKGDLTHQMDLETVSMVALMTLRVIATISMVMEINRRGWQLSPFWNSQSRIKIKIEKSKRRISKGSFINKGTDYQKFRAQILIKDG